MNDLKSQLEKLTSFPPVVDIFPFGNSSKREDSDHSQLISPLLSPNLSPLLTSFSNDIEDFDHGSKKSSGIIKETDENLSFFFSQVKAIQSNIEALQDTLQGLKSRQEKLSKKYTKSLSNVMDLDMSDLVSQALSIKVRLDALEQENLENRKIGGNMYQKGSPVDRVRVLVTNKLRADLRGFIADLTSLQARMRESEKSDLRRMLYIFKGEIIESDEVLERMIDSGDGRELIRKTIREQGLADPTTHQASKTGKQEASRENLTLQGEDNKQTKALNHHVHERSQQRAEQKIQIKPTNQSIAHLKDEEEENIKKKTATNQSYDDSFLVEEARELSYLHEKENIHLKVEFMEEIDQRYGSMRKLEENLIALKQTFLQMGELVDIQGEELNDIEKNLLKALSSVKAAVGEQSGAKEEAEEKKKKQKAIAKVVGPVVVVVLLIAAVAVLLLLLLQG